MNRIVVATGNKNKLKEITEIFRNTDFEFLSLDDLDIHVDVVEDSDTLEGNAYKKASEIMKLTDLPTLADDTGLMVDALNGAPGVYSARFSGEHANYKKNNELLMKLMKDVPNDKRSAKFATVMVLLYPDGRCVTARGEINGYISRELRGSEGFGYDPLFIVPEYGRTFAELGSDIKNKISHRSRALMDLKRQLDSGN